MTTSSTPITRRITTALIGFAAAVALLGSAPGAAHAQRYSAEIFPNLYGAGNVAIAAWSEYLGHCSYVNYWAYENAEYPDYSDAYAFAPLQGCDIYLNVDQAEMFRYTWFCSVLVHEMGHSAGLDHISDPRDIMHATNEVYWRQCLTRKQARKFRRRGEILDNSIWSTAYAKLSTAAEEDPTAAEIDAAIAAGALDVQRVGRIRVR